MARKIPNVLTEEEQAALLRQPNRKCPTGYRNWLLMRLMLDTGLRVSEAAHLCWSGIDMTSGRIMVVQGKGSKDAVLWANADDIEALQAWRSMQAEALASRGHADGAQVVFSTLDGKPVLPRYVEYMVQRYARKAGIEKRVYPHLLRHSFATDLLRETGNLRVVQKACRHARVSTTEIYTHIVDSELEAAMRSFRHSSDAPA